MFDGQEVSFALTPSASTTVTATLTGATDSSVFALGSTSGACQPVAACLDSDAASVSFAATAGETYYLVVDGPLDNATPDFSLQVTCP